MIIPNKTFFPVLPKRDAIVHNCSPLELFFKTPLLKECAMKRSERRRRCCVSRSLSLNMLARESALPSIAYLDEVMLINIQKLSVNESLFPVCKYWSCTHLHFIILIFVIVMQLGAIESIIHLNTLLRDIIFISWKVDNYFLNSLHVYYCWFDYFNKIVVRIVKLWCIVVNNSTLAHLLVFQFFPSVHLI